MIVLGVETSCDETAVAVVKDKRILSNSVSSSIDLHKSFGGVIPEIACRYHVEYINYVLCDALKAANKRLKDIDLIAVTMKPGLVGALLVGVSLAKALSLALDVPIIGVDHLIAHLYAAYVSDRGRNVRGSAEASGRGRRGEPELPFVGMVVSGGHTNLFLVRDVKCYKLLGQTLDDAAGEAFDKVAKLLNLGYPGGPVIEKRAAKGKIDKNLFSLDSFDDSLNFSFSGIKTAVLYYLRDRIKKNGSLNSEEVNDIAACFQDAVTDILTIKAIEACARERVKTLVLGGGVVSNAQLREKIIGRAEENGIKLHLPPKRLCLDNAAMVAGLGGALYKKGVKSDLHITAQSSSVYPVRD